MKVYMTKYAMAAVGGSSVSFNFIWCGDENIEELLRTKEKSFVTNKWHSYSGPYTLLKELPLHSSFKSYRNLFVVDIAIETLLTSKEREIREWAVTQVGTI